MRERALVLALAGFLFGWESTREFDAGHSAADNRELVSRANEPLFLAGFDVPESSETGAPDSVTGCSWDSF